MQFQHDSCLEFSSGSLQRTKCIFYSILYILISQVNVKNIFRWLRITCIDYDICYNKIFLHQKFVSGTFSCYLLQTPLKRGKCIFPFILWPIILVSVVQKEAFRPLSITYHYTRTMPFFFSDVKESDKYLNFHYIWNFTVSITYQYT